MTESHAARSRGGFVYLLKNSPHVLEEQLAGRTQLHTAWQAFEKIEA